MPQINKNIITKKEKDHIFKQDRIIENKDNTQIKRYPFRVNVLIRYKLEAINNIYYTLILILIILILVFLTWSTKPSCHL